MAASPGSSSRTLGRYELIQELAKSQLGALWVAFVPGGDDQLVAIRRVNTGAPVTPEDKDALSEGAWWTLELTHPRIARGIDVVMSDSELGIACEYHEGEVLRSLLRLASFKRKPIPVKVALRIASDVLEALEEAESQAQPLTGGQSSYAGGGLVPDSVLVGSDGVGRLLDVGIAGASSRVSNVARNPEMVSYFSPEQIAGGTPDIRSNVYSVGVMLWEMLAGKRLYVGSTYTAVTERIQSGQPPRLDASKPVGGDPIPSAVADVVARALSSDPAARYASPRELIEAIASAQEPATHEEVAALVDDLAGNTLATRRKVIDRARNPAQAAKSLIGAARAAAKSAPDLGRAQAKSAPDLGRAPAKSAPDLGRARSATKPGVAPPPPRERKQTLLGIAPAPQPPPALRDSIDSIDSIDSAELESISKVEALPVEPTESALVGALTRDSTDSAKSDDADAPGTHIKTQVLGTPAVMPAAAAAAAGSAAQAEDVEEPPISLEPLSEVESVKPEPPARPPPPRERAASKPDSDDAKDDSKPDAKEDVKQDDDERSSGDSAVAWLGPPPGVALDDDLDGPVPSRVDPAKKSKLTMIVGGIVAGAAVVLLVALAMGGKPDETSEPETAKTSEPEPESTTAKAEPPKPAPEPPKEEPKPEPEPEPEETAKAEPEPEPEETAKAEPEPAPKPKPVSRPTSTWKPRTTTKPKPKPKFTPSGI